MGKKSSIWEIRKTIQKNIDSVLILEQTPEQKSKQTKVKIDYQKVKNKFQKEIQSFKKKYKKNILSQVSTIQKETTTFIKKHNSNLRKGLLITGLFAAILLLIEIGILTAKYTLTDKIPYNTYLADIDMSFKTLDEAEILLTRKIDAFKDNSLTVSVNNQNYEFSLDEIGTEINTQNSLKNIKTINRDYSQIEMIQDFFNKKEMPVDFDFNEEEALKKMEEKIEFLKENKTKNASYFLDENGNIIVNEEKEGISVDMSGFKKQLASSINELSLNKITVNYNKEAPLITASLLEKEKDRLSSKLHEEISMTSFEGSWKFNPNEYVDSLIFNENYTFTFKPLDISLPIKPNDNTIIEENDLIGFSHDVKLKIKPERVETYINEEIAPNINMESESAKIFTDENGNIKFEGTATIGKKVSSQALISMIELSLNNEVKDLNIPVIEQRPDIDVSGDLQKKGIIKLIAVGHSQFAGSPANRIHNIGVGMDTISGAMIGPGETFSFAEQIGTVDGSTGYKPELVIKPEGTVPEYGGGLCQVSSTFYRAALWGGFEIVDRRPHSYAVSYYAQVGGWGLDATVYPPAVDFKFKNNTPNNILLQSYTDGVDAWVKVYGTDDGRKVEMEGPYVGNYRYPGGAVTVVSDSLAPGQQKWVEKSHTGFDATWYRHFIDADGNYTKETIFTRYNAIPAKVMVGREAAQIAQASSPESVQENPL